jgi:hypothetical protein
MLGAILMLVLFLAIHREAGDMVGSLLREAGWRMDGQTPFEETAAVIMLAAAVGAALLMFRWRRTPDSVRYQILRRYLASPQGSQCKAVRRSPARAPKM